MSMMSKIAPCVIILFMLLAGEALGQSKTVKFAFSWPPNATYTALFVASDKGYFQKEGLEARYTIIGKAADTIRLVAKGEQDFGLATPQMIIISREKGMKLIAVSARYVTSPVGIASKAEKGIVKVEDLIGKTMGIPSYASVVYLGLRAMLLKANIPESKVKIKVVGFRGDIALARDQVDGIPCFIPGNCVLTGKGEKLEDVMGVKINVLKASDYTKVGGFTFYTRQRLLGESPLVVEKFVRAVNRATRYTIDHPDNALGSFVKQNPRVKKIPRAALMLYLKVGNQFMENELTKKHGLGWQSLEDWQSIHDFLISVGLIKQRHNVKELFTNRFIRP